MKMDKIANSGNDEFYTPLYAIKPILKYLPPPSGVTIWCPFDTENSLFVKTFRNNEYNVIATHISSSCLRLSNIKNYKYDLIWDKVNMYTGALLANKRPMRRHENISVFYKKQPTYNKQMTYGQPYTMTRNTNGVGEYATKSYKRIKTVNTGEKNPCTIIEIEGGNKSEKGLHPTQKPVQLLEYLIKTYSNENDTILDNCMGSGSTGVACVNTNRNFIGIELDEKYFKIAEERINNQLNNT